MKDVETRLVPSLGSWWTVVKTPTVPMDKKEEGVREDIFTFIMVYESGNGRNDLLVIGL